MPRLQKDTRRVVREQARAAASLRTHGGEETATALTDVSTHGCCIRVEERTLRLGQFVALSLTDAGTVQAIVRWVRGGQAGLEFLRPVALPLVHRLAAD